MKTNTTETSIGYVVTATGGLYDVIAFANASRDEGAKVDFTDGATLPSIDGVIQPCVAHATYRTLSREQQAAEAAAAREDCELRYAGTDLEGYAGPGLRL